MARMTSARWLPVLALLPALLIPGAQAQTASWPGKPVKIVVTFPPGGAPDTLARVLADKWGQALGQTFTVDNKPGAGGNMGADFVAKSPPDGSTLGLDLAPGTPEALATLIQAETVKWARVVKESGAKAD